MSSEKPVKYIKFKSLKWWQKILLILLVIFGLSAFIWLAISLLLWGINSSYTKDGAGLNAFLFNNSNNTALWIWIVCLIVVAGGVLYIFIKYSSKFKKNKDDSEPDLKPHWLSQAKLQKRLVVLRDDIESSYATWCLAGIKNVTNSKGNVVKEQCSYHLLACDKLCLQKKLQKEGKGTTINGGKDIKSLIGGASIIVGAGRSGKTRQVVKPTILHLLNSKAKPSMIICDQKGDIFEMSARIAKAKGYNVYRFNTCSSKHSHTWNPLSEIWHLYYDKETGYLPNWLKVYELSQDKDLHSSKGQSCSKTEINRLKAIYQDARAKIENRLEKLVTSVNPIDEHAKDKFFDRQAQNLIKLYLLLPLEFGIIESEYTLYNVATNALQYENKLMIFTDRLPKWAICKTLAGQFADLDAKTSSSDVKDTASKALNSLAMQDIKNLTSPTLIDGKPNSIDFKEFVEKPTVLYVSVDITADDNAYNRLAVLFMEMLYGYLQDYLNSRNMTAFENPILFIIDEFGNLPKMQFILNTFALNQGQNITALLILQSATGQIDKIYDQNDRKKLFDNCQAFILTSGVDPQFAKWLSDKAGSSYRTSVSTSTSESGKDDHSSSSKSVSKHYTADIPADEFSNIKPNKELVLFPIGMKPAKLEYITLDKLTWFNEFVDKYNNNSEVKVDFGEKNYDELDYFQDRLDGRIINNWINTYASKQDQTRTNLAVRLREEPWYQKYQDLKTNMNDFKQQYENYGGYYCLALHIVDSEKYKPLEANFGSQRNKNKENSGRNFNVEKQKQAFVKHRDDQEENNFEDLLNSHEDANEDVDDDNSNFDDVKESKILSTGNKFLDSFDDSILISDHKHVIDEINKKIKNIGGPSDAETKALFIEACVYMYRSEAEKLFGHEMSKKIIQQINFVKNEAWQQWIAIQTSENALYKIDQIKDVYSRIWNYHYFVKDKKGNNVLDKGGMLICDEFNQYFIKKIILLCHNSLINSKKTRQEEYEFFKKEFPELFGQIRNVEEFEIMWDIMKPENVDHE